VAEPRRAALGSKAPQDPSPRRGTTRPIPECDHEQLRTGCEWMASIRGLRRAKRIGHVPRNVALWIISTLGLSRLWCICLAPSRQRTRGVGRLSPAVVRCAERLFVEDGSWSRGARAIESDPNPVPVAPAAFCNLLHQDLQTLPQNRGELIGVAAQRVLSGTRLYGIIRSLRSVTRRAIRERGRFAAVFGS
jgi:hypothetical protein